MVKRTRFATCVAIPLALGVLVAQAQTEAAGPPPTIVVPSAISSLDTRIMDATADPCTDFAQYACGNFATLYPIPSDRSGYGTGQVMYARGQFAIQRLLEDAGKRPDRLSSNERKAGQFYEACVNTHQIDAVGISALAPELRRIAALDNKAGLTDVLAHLQLIGVPAFFSFGEQQAFTNSQQQIAYLDQGGIGLPERDYYIQTNPEADQTRQLYVQHVARILELLGEPATAAKDDAGQILKLETSLATASLDPTAHRDPKNLNHITQVSALESVLPEIVWSRFFALTGTPSLASINVEHPPFFQKLGQLLQTTDLGTIKAYLRWQLVYNTPAYALPTALDEAHFAFFSRTLRGRTTQQPRRERCADAVDAELGDALGQLYVSQEFSPKARSAALEMSVNIERAMDREIDTLDWMSPATKARAKEKLKLIANNVGYPAHWRDYSKLVIRQGDLIGDTWRANEFENRRTVSKDWEAVESR